MSVVFSLRRGELAAYFPDARSANFDWKAHPRFVCDRCSGVTVVDRDETMIAECCLFCDTPRPGEAQYGPGLLEQMVELGSLRQRVMWLEEALREARHYDLSVRLKRKIDEYLARVAPGSSESATTRGHGSRGVDDSTPPVGPAQGVGLPAGGTSDQISDQNQQIATITRERDAAEDGFRYEQQRADRAEAEVERLRDALVKGLREDADYCQCGGWLDAYEVITAALAEPEGGDDE